MHMYFLSKVEYIYIEYPTCDMCYVFDVSKLCCILLKAPFSHHAEMPIY